MKNKHRWYERLFFALLLAEKRWFRLVGWLLLLLIVIQGLLMIDSIRKALALAERLEGEPVKFIKNLDRDGL
jgi:hypothetical protein